MAFLVITCRAGGCAQGNSDAANAINLVIAAPIWIPAALVVCATGGCKAEKGQRVTEETLAAAEKGDPQAQYEVGQYYEVTSGLDTATPWYTKSAEQGYGKSQFRLGLMHEFVDKDYVQADIWYLVAAAWAPEADSIKRAAVLYCDDLEKRMRPEQIAEPRKRAQEWKPTQSGANAQARPPN